MVGEERALGLRGLGAPLRHEPGDGALSDIDTELREFPVDARRTSQGIRGGHLSHKGGDLGIDARTASGRPTRELGPVLARDLRRRHPRTHFRRRTRPRRWGHGAFTTVHVEPTTCRPSPSASLLPRSPPVDVLRSCPRWSHVHPVILAAVTLRATSLSASILANFLKMSHFAENRIGTRCSRSLSCTLHARASPATASCRACQSPALAWWIFTSGRPGAVGLSERSIRRNRVPLPREAISACGDGGNLRTDQSLREAPLSVRAPGSLPAVEPLASAAGCLPTYRRTQSDGSQPFSW
jgi:hypothetical protein